MFVTVAAAATAAAVAFAAATKRGSSYLHFYSGIILLFVRLSVGSNVD